MRVLSMQSHKVWEILQRDGEYRADLAKCREHSRYQEDVEQLGGAVPIWCWAYPDIDYYTMYDGSIFEYLRCEMSLQQDGCWDGFIMLELDVPKEMLHIGKHHNDCPHSMVFAQIDFDMVCAVYTIRDSDNNGWYYKVFTPVYMQTGSNPLFTKETDTAEECKTEAYPTSDFTEGESGTCIKCGCETVSMFRGKHFHSKECVLEHKTKFIAKWGMAGLYMPAVRPMYDALSESMLRDLGAWDCIRYLAGKLSGSVYPLVLKNCQNYITELDSWVAKYTEVCNET